MKPENGNDRQDRGVTVQRSSSGDVDAFVAAARKHDPDRRGRLVFALDATMSRQPTWDRAMTVQSAMFDAVRKVGGLAVQLVYFRGFEECRASRWVIESTVLRDLMTTIDCRGGQTQIARVLRHVLREAAQRRIGALVYIGDALEENVDQLCRQAGELGVRGVRCFFFHEGRDPVAESGFREMARLSSGAYFRLGPDSARELELLLGAVAIYAEGGMKALAESRSEGARLLLQQMNR